MRVPSWRPFQPQSHAINRGEIAERMTVAEAGESVQILNDLKALFIKSKGSTQMNRTCSSSKLLHSFICYKCETAEMYEMLAHSAKKEKKTHTDVPWHLSVGFMVSWFHDLNLIKVNL